jgi:hypothetical protein
MFRVRRPHVLLVGPATEVDRTFDQMRTYLGSPLVDWRPHETSTFPTTRFRTLVIRGVDRLDAVQQQFLNALLRATAGRTQVIALSQIPIFPLVQRGQFLEGLYYQLNAVYLDLNDKQTTD